jgi:enoyl-CoA hydratase/carnithine racemase
MVGEAVQGLQTLGYREDGDVAHITLLRPRIDMAMVRELTRVCDHLEDESSCKVVVFRGADGRFSEGIDFQDFRPDQPMDIHGFNKWEKCCVRIERLPKATIAIVEGTCAGGGAQLALVTDATIAHPSARIHFNEVHLGFLPGMATFRLAKHVGLGHAKRLIMQCPVLEPEQAQALGLVQTISEDLDVALAETIAAFGPIHTVAVHLARRLLNESYSVDFENAVGHFLAAQHRAIGQTAFLDTLKRLRDE